MDNKSAMEKRVVQTLDCLNIVNDALLKAKSNGAEVVMLTFTEFVFRVFLLPYSELVSGNWLMKPSC